MKLKKKKWIQKVFIIASIFFPSIALFADVKSTGNLSMAINGTGVVQFIEFIALIVIVLKCEKKFESYRISKRSQKYYFLLAILLATFMIIGRKQDAHKDLKYIFIAAPMYIGYIILFWGGAILLDFEILQRIKTFSGKSIGKISSFVFEKHPLIAPMAVIWLCRLPWLIAFYPCTVSWDGATQILDFYGRELFTNHHPPLVSFLYGNITWYSNQAGIDNIGMFMIPIMQVLLSSFAAARGCQLLKKLKAPIILRWCSLLYYAAFTVWCIYDCTIIKDTLYYPLVLLFGIKYIECLLNEKLFFQKKRNFIEMMLYGVLMTQIRNNGIFVLVLCLLTLLCVLKRNRKIVIAIGLVSSLLLIGVVENCVYPAFGVTLLEDKVDKYCILFQQTAKYSIEYPGDVTEDEREVLNQLFDYDELAKVYNPHLADWVKNCLRVQEGSNEDPTNSAFANLRNDYLRVWFQQFCRHPWVYIETFFECSYGYYYPDSRVYKEGYGEYELSHFLLSVKMSNIFQIENLGVARFLLEQISKVEYFPGIGMLYRCGFYTWVLVVITVFFLKDKKYKAALCGIPAIVNVLICLISPVNTCIRYMMPTMCFLPILICLFWCQYKQNSGE